jgi:hypothetical protein
MASFVAWRFTAILNSGSSRVRVSISKDSMMRLTWISGWIKVIHKLRYV